jgi:hypothetical protein
MGSFTWEVKREMLSPPQNTCCKIAQCAGYLRTNGSITSSAQGLGFEVVGENERIAEYFISLFESVFGVRLVLKDASIDPKRDRDKLTFSYSGEGALQILEKLGVLREEEGGIGLQLGIDASLVENECCTLSYIKGAFLGGGSCTIPSGESKTGYHLEFVFSSHLMASDFCELLAQFELLGKVAPRGEKWLVYLKSRDELSDFFSLMETDSALRRLNAVSDAREESNQENRVNNCFVGNCDRTARASAEQTVAIEKLEREVGLDSLEPSLKELAQMRLKYPMESLSKLADRMGLSKSCLSHRMRKLMEVSHELE